MCIPLPLFQASSPHNPDRSFRMSDLELKLYGKPLFLLPNPLPPVPIQQIHSTPLPTLPQLPLAPHNPWDQVLNTSLFPFPPPIGLPPNQMLDLVNMNPQLPLLPIPFNPLLPFGFPNPLLPLPKFPPVPLMSLRLATPPPFRSHPYRQECRSAETKENVITNVCQW